MLSDKELVLEVLDGSVESYAVLVDRWQRAAIAEALRTVRDGHLAEDIAQEAFVAAYEKLGSLRDPKMYGSWLLRICRNKAVDFVRKQNVRVKCSSLDTCGIDIAEKHSKPDMKCEELVDYVLKLPDHEKQVVTLKYFGGHTVRELAAITSRSIGTVTKQLSRAHARLRQQMERGLK